jgi:acyl-CoA thioester hydrolase
MGPALQAFEIVLPVEPADLDQLGHVNNVTYVRWVQEAAVAHWQAVAPAADQSNVL